MKLRKGDTVKIISGKDKSKSGKILRVFSEKGSVLVEGINQYKKHAKPKKQGEKGQVIIVPRPMNSSNVKIVCPSCGQASRVGYKVEEKNKTRYCKKCKATI
ncbi:MAG: 50S ribosomal protein L24 [Candidatus Paceibacterota bacterium]|jgi:large subunit ribosomal protein L24